jgi:Putative transposase
LEPFELIRRFLQHVLPRGYTRVRCFGFFHPAARLRLNRVRALLKQKPLLSAAEQEAWQAEPKGEPAESPSPDSTPASVNAPPLCRRCGLPMILQAHWRPGQIPPRPWERAPPKPP